MHRPKVGSIRWRQGAPQESGGFSPDGAHQATFTANTGIPLYIQHVVLELRVLATWGIYNIAGCW